MVANAPFSSVSQQEQSTFDMFSQKTQSKPRAPPNASNKTLTPCRKWKRNDRLNSMSVPQETSKPHSKTATCAEYSIDFPTRSLADAQHVQVLGGEVLRPDLLDDLGVDIPEHGPLEVLHALLEALRDLAVGTPLKDVADLQGLLLRHLLVVHGLVPQHGLRPGTAAEYPARRATERGR